MTHFPFYPFLSAMLVCKSLTYNNIKFLSLLVCGESREPPEKHCNTAKVDVYEYIWLVYARYIHTLCDRNKYKFSGVLNFVEANNRLFERKYTYVRIRARDAGCINTSVLWHRLEMEKRKTVRDLSHTLIYSAGREHHAGPLIHFVCSSIQQCKRIYMQHL